MPTFGNASIELATELWQELRRRVPTWFQACLNDQGEDSASFMTWLMMRRVTWIRTRDVVVFLVPKEQRHVVEVHLALMSMPLASLHLELCELMQWIFALGWRRIEIPVTEIAGRSIRKALREMGFQKEGTMRQATRGFDRRLGQERYMDVDLWSILKEGDTNGL